MRIICLTVFHTIFIGDIRLHPRSLLSTFPYLHPTVGPGTVRSPERWFSDKYCSQDHVDGQKGARVVGGSDQDINGNGYVKEGYKNWILTIEHNISFPRPRPCTRPPPTP